MWEGHIGRPVGGRGRGCRGTGDQLVKLPEKRGKWEERIPFSHHRGVCVCVGGGGGGSRKRVVMLQKAIHVTIVPFLWFPPFQCCVMTLINCPVGPNVIEHFF